MNRSNHTVLVTRPEPAATALCKRLEGLGYNALAWPLLDVNFFPVDLRAAEATDNLIFTSKNALIALERTSAISDEILSKTIFSVGQATTDYATQMGFTNILTGQGTAKALGELIIQSHPKDANQHFLHLSASETAFDLGAFLQETSIDFSRQIVYETCGTTSFPENVKQAFEVGQINHILLMSPKTASIFIEYVEAADLWPLLYDIRLLCLSDDISARMIKIAPQLGQQTEIASTPNLQSLLALLP